MALVSDLELPSFDFMDASLRGDRFHDTMASLRERSWLAAGDLGFFVLDREASEFILRSKKVKFPGLQVAEVFGVTEGPLYEEITRNILNIDGDDHRRLRNLVNPALTPRAVERYRPAMRGFIEELFGKVAADGRCEFVDAIAKPYPALVIATVMGAPLDDASRLYYWSNWIQRQFSADLADKRDVIEQAVVEFYEYVGALLERRRSDPGDDLVSRLLAAEHEGDRLSDVECVNLVLNVLIGGVDTTQSQLAQAIRLFCEHPEQWQQLREHPELVPAAVEEVLRFEPITPVTARITIEDVEYRDVTFPEGTVVMVSSFNGNRDPAAIEDPDRFDIAADRDREKPLTFGAGIHYCLGANLARAELQEGLGFLSERIAQLELDGEAEFESIHGIYGLGRLPIRFQPA